MVLIYDSVSLFFDTYVSFKKGKICVQNSHLMRLCRIHILNVILSYLVTKTMVPYVGFS